MFPRTTTPTVIGPIRHGVRSMQGTQSQTPEDPYLLTSFFLISSAEILEYFKRFADEEDLHHYIHLSTSVRSAVWDESKGIYIVNVESTTGEKKEDWCHVLINAGGNLNKWKCAARQPPSFAWRTYKSSTGPDVKTLHSFAGDLLHSANYPKDKDLSGKRVAVIGTGSSAIQVCGHLNMCI